MIVSITILWKHLVWLFGWWSGEHRVRRCDPSLQLWITFHDASQRQRCFTLRPLKALKRLLFNWKCRAFHLHQGELVSPLKSLCCWHTAGACPHLVLHESAVKVEPGITGAASLERSLVQLHRRTSDICCTGPDNNTRPNTQHPDLRWVMKGRALMQTADNHTGGNWKLDECSEAQSDV